MRRCLCVAVSAVLLAALSAPIAGAKQRAADRMNAYTAVVRADQLGTLAEQGFELTGQRKVAGGIEVGLVATRDQRDKLAQAGIRVRLTRVRGGQTVRQFAIAQAENGFQVWRSWDEPGGFSDQMYAIARDNPQIAKLVKLGTTGQGREILAIKLTQGARGQRDGSRPAVLYSSLQHAREWIASEVNRRLLNWYIDRWRANDREVRSLLKDTELWFVLVANPDGYEYTFDVERLWRKNLRDNNGDGQITVGDGVDPNRNFPNHFKYDEEGSSSIASSDTYRGPAPASEPETTAMKGLLDRIGFAFQVNYHSNGQWLLYAEGWQIATPTADDPIYFALSGNLDRPAIGGLPPGSELRRPVRDQRRDDGLRARGRRARWRGRRSSATAVPRTAGSCSPTTRRLVQEEFERNLPFALSVARSAKDPDDPDVGRSASRRSPSTSKSDDPYKDGIPGVELRVRLLLRRPAAGPGAGQAQPRARHAEVPHQRRRRAQRPDLRVGRRRAVQARGRVLPRDARRGDRHQPGRLRRGVVRGWRRAERLVHVPSRLRESAAGCSWSRPRTTRAPRPRRRRGRTTCSTTSTRSRRTGSRPTCTTSTRAAESRRTTSACSATTTP